MIHYTFGGGKEYQHTNLSRASVWGQNQVVLSLRLVHEAPKSGLRHFQSFEKLVMEVAVQSLLANGGESSRSFEI